MKIRKGECGYVCVCVCEIQKRKREKQIVREKDSETCQDETPMVRGLAADYS